MRNGTRRLAVVVVLACVGVAAAAEVRVSRLRLRSSVTPAGGALTLGDLLVFGDADPELVAKLADEPVFADTRDAVRSAVTHDEVVQRLTALEVNPALVLVDGASVCKLMTEPPATSQSSAGGAGSTKGGDHAGKSTTNTALAAHRCQPAEGTQPADGASLADRIRELINRDLATLGGTGEIEFERAGREYLDLTLPFEFEIRAADREKLGMREFRVAVKRNGRTERTTTVTARVRLIRETVVARRPLSIGNIIREGDVGLEPQVFESLSAIGLDKVDHAIGRQVTRFFPAGELIRTDGLKAVDLVQRSKPVTVLSGDGGVQMRLAGIALDAGAYGDSIRVRLGEGRNARQQVQASVVGVNTVKLSEAGR